MKIVLAFLSVLALAACASTSPPSPDGDTYYTRIGCTDCIFERGDGWITCSYESTPSECDSRCRPRCIPAGVTGATTLSTAVDCMDGTCACAEGDTVRCYRPE